MYLIDTHAHLDGEEFSEDLPDVIQRAKDEGIEKIFIPGICLKDTQHLIDVCNSYPGYLYPMIGLHPENIMDEDYHTALKELEKFIIPSNAIAIGEVGLDFYWDDTYKKEQMEAFETQIEWAKNHNLPLMIHSRNAHKELMAIMEKYRSYNLSGVFHCFTGTVEEAKDLLSFPNFMLGIGGVLTFKKSTLREVVQEAIPLSRIVLETDSPYMAPVPNRGKRNESAFVKLVAEKLSEVLNEDFDNIVLQTRENAMNIFKKASFFQK